MANTSARLNAMRRAAQKARAKGPEREEPGEVEPRNSNNIIEVAEEKREDRS